MPSHITIIDLRSKRFTNQRNNKKILDIKMIYIINNYYGMDQD